MGSRSDRESQPATLLDEEVTRHIAALLLGNAQQVNGDRASISAEHARRAALVTARELHESALHVDRYPYQSEAYGVRFYFEMEDEYPGAGMLTAWLWDEDQWRPIGVLEVGTESA